MSNNARDSVSDALPPLPPQKSVLEKFPSPPERVPPKAGSSSDLGKLAAKPAKQVIPLSDDEESSTEERSSASGAAAAAPAARSSSSSASGGGERVQVVEQDSDSDASRSVRSDELSTSSR